MNREQIIAALKEERDRLDWAIAMLGDSSASRVKSKPLAHAETQVASPSVVKGKTRGRRKMSAEARARIAAATKARWARFRKEKAKAAAKK